MSAEPPDRTPAASPNVDDRTQYAAWLAQVRAHDIDRYLSALLAPAGRCPELVTLYAFDADLSRIPRSVSAPLLGEIRLQWWRDALAPLLARDSRSTGEPQRTGHPLADALIDLAHRRSLNGGLLHGLIDAGSFALADQPLADAQQLWTHLTKTEAAILSLAAGVLGEPPSPTLDQAAETSGRAIGLVRAARRLVALAPGAAHLVPLTLWRAEERDKRPDGPGREAAANAHVRAAAGELLDLAETALPSAHAALSRLRRTSRRAFLPLALVPRYLTHLRRWGGEVADGSQIPRDINPLTRLWTLTSACWRHPWL